MGSVIHYYSRMSAPWCDLEIRVDRPGALVAIHLYAKGATGPDGAERNDSAGGTRAVSLVEDATLTAPVSRQLSAWFSGESRVFDLVLAPAGTPFQLEVWEALRNIPFGETRTYDELARSLGRRRGARAIGGAVGANPIPIVIPCHRVVGSDGSLTGFGGGLPLKAALLDHESRVLGLQGRLF